MSVKITAQDARRMGLKAPRRQKKDVKRSKDITAEMFCRQCVAHNLPVPTPEYQFCSTRKWAFDFAWYWEGCGVSVPVALEVEGAIWTQGRHTRGSGFLNDMEKYNEAAIMRWIVLRCSRADFNSGKVFELLKRAL
jgi:hypothetical protein